MIPPALGLGNCRGACDDTAGPLAVRLVLDDVTLVTVVTRGEVLVRDVTLATAVTTLARDGTCLATVGIGANETVLVAEDLLTVAITEGVFWSEDDALNDGCGATNAVDADPAIETTPPPAEAGLAGLPLMLPSVSSSASRKALSRATVACLSLFRSS